MLANVTNRAAGARGFETKDRGTVLLEAGESARLDLEDHALHRAWAAAGEVSIAPIDTAPAAEAKPALRRPGRGERKPV